MDNLKIYCMCLQNSNLEIIKNLNYIPVGLKNNDFSKEWLRDNTKENISEKNHFYGEYTFYYWYWKNLLKYKKENEWVGFCPYRIYWKNKNNINSNKLKDLVLQNYEPEWKNFDAIIGEPMSISGAKVIKIIKYGKLAILRNPKAIFSRSCQTIRWQFDMFHGSPFPIGKRLFGFGGFVSGERCSPSAPPCRSSSPTGRFLCRPAGRGRSRCSPAPR